MPADANYGEPAKKALVRGTISYLESQGLPVNKSAIFRHFELSRSQGYAALTIPASKRNDPEWEETRGRPSKISTDDQLKMERILWDVRFEAANLTWKVLAREAGVGAICNQRTLNRTMGTLGYRRCLGCGRCWVLNKTKERRVDYARRMLEAFPDPPSWRSVRFSGELHFGFGLDGTMRLLPRAGEKFCEPCSQTTAANWPRDLKRVHAWAAVGYGFKSELVFYEESTSPNCPGTLTMTTYCDRVLSGVVAKWMSPAGGGGGGSHAFVLEEDVDGFAHGGASKVNDAQTWKDASGLRCHFSCGDSPDLSPLDSLWPPGKQWKAPAMPPAPADWEDASLRQAARDAWEGMLDQGRVNIWVDFMPQRLRQVLDTEGRMVPW